MTPRPPASGPPARPGVPSGEERGARWHRVDGQRSPQGRRGAVWRGHAVALVGGILALTTASPASAPAQHAPPRLTVVGVGAGVSCAEWAAGGRADPELEQWAFGFASAVAAGSQLRQGGDPLGSMDAEAIHAWLGEHCRRRPGDALSVALIRMVLAAPR